ncbi:hypothetical protein O6H91_11G074200 [Diphasiastrum complanatum]|uniref:Uncharacterized protein n=1 Tax=Diphasiastrum complanatum TaxID=34168 RepID=A0ACC2CAW2_DIPCM|nr:hypothetical protein O6H91_11G074200 [Diphasiastrum complanatum]
MTRIVLMFSAATKSSNDKESSIFIAILQTFLLFSYMYFCCFSAFSDIFPTFFKHFQLFFVVFSTSEDFLLFFIHSGYFSSVFSHFQTFFRYFQWFLGCFLG